MHDNANMETMDLLQSQTESLVDMIRRIKVENSDLILKHDKKDKKNKKDKEKKHKKRSKSKSNKKHHSPSRTSYEYFAEKKRQELRDQSRDKRYMR